MDDLTKILTQLVFPLPVALVLGVLGLVLLGRGRQRAATTFLAAGLGLLWVASIPVVGSTLNNALESQYPPVPPEQATPADVIVVLGGVVTPPAPPRNWVNLSEGVDRLVHAARLYRAGKAPWVIASGGGGPQIGSDQKPADVMGDLLVEWGVPREALLLEKQSHNTWENGFYTRQLMRERGLRSVLVVTSARHMPRAMAVFRSLGVEAIPAPTDFGLGRVRVDRLLAWIPDAGVLRTVSACLKEHLGLWVYELRGWAREESEEEAAQRLRSG